MIYYVGVNKDGVEMCLLVEVEDKANITALKNIAVCDQIDTIWGCQIANLWYRKHDLSQRVTSASLPLFWHLKIEP